MVRASHQTRDLHELESHDTAACASDPYVNALGIKGVGEIGIMGTAGAVAKTVWPATGVRIRRLGTLGLRYRCLPT